MGALKTLRLKESSTSHKSGRRMVPHVVGDTIRDGPKNTTLWVSGHRSSERLSAVLIRLHGALEGMFLHCRSYWWILQTAGKAVRLCGTKYQIFQSLRIGDRLFVPQIAPQ